MMLFGMNFDDQVRIFFAVREETVVFGSGFPQQKL